MASVVQVGVAANAKIFTLPVAPTLGNTLVLMAQSVNIPSAANALTGWRLIVDEPTGVSPPGSSGRVAVWSRAVAPGDGASITISDFAFSGGGSYVGWLSEYSPALVPVSIAAATSNGAASVSPGNAIALGGGIVLSAVCYTDGDGHAWTQLVPDAAWTTRYNSTNGEFLANSNYFGDRVVTPGTYDPVGTLGRADQAWAAVAVAFGVLVPNTFGDGTVLS